MKTSSWKHLWVLALCGLFLSALGCARIKPDAESPEISGEGTGVSENPLDPIFPHSDEWASPSDHGVWIVQQGGYELCLQCHDIGSSTEAVSPSVSDSEAGVPTCASCHTFYPHTENWRDKENHGAEVLANGTASCATQCHGTDLQGGLSGVSCNSCHTIYPHSDQWQETHSSAVEEGGVSACQGCHGTDLMGGASGVSCFSCHADYPHPDRDEWVPYMGGHGERVQNAYSGSTVACQMCHGEDLAEQKDGENCFTCHASFPHLEANWNTFEGHGDYGLTNTIGECALCHGDDYQGGDRENTSCYSCHISYPHLEGWRADSGPQPHGIFATANTSASCATARCHGVNLTPTPDVTMGPDCGDCHAGYPHGDGWVRPSGQPQGHGEYVINISSNSCASAQCHGTDFTGGGSGISCFACHASYPHSGTWQSDHATYVRDTLGNDMTECKRCHAADLSGGNTGVSCNDCHYNTVGCAACHDEAKSSPPWQADRRQILGVGGDFTRASHHVDGSVTDADCTACHYMGDHWSGTVKLKDPDQGEALVYDFNPADPSGIEDFCLNCHDTNGAVAGNGMEPFSDGKTVPNVKGILGSLWADSAHKQIGYSENAGNPLSCFGDGTTNGCHSNAHGSDNERLLSAAAGVTIEQFCYNCHTDGMIQNDALSNNRTGGYVSADDIEEAFSKSSKHNLGTTFSISGDDFTVQCTTCHNPHVVTGKYWDAGDGKSPITRPDFSNPADNTRAMGTSLWGAATDQKMGDFAALAAGTGGWYFGVARGDLLSFDQPAFYQPPKDGSGYSFEYDGDILPDYTTFCLDCHTHRIGTHPPVNWGQGIGCTGNGVDPPDQRIACNAPHGLGSANRPYAWGDAGMFGSSGNPDPIFSEPGVTRGRGARQFMRWPYDSVQRNAGINFVMSCTDCHEGHGSNRGSIIRERLNVNANGDCGTGGNPDPDGENCNDGGNWNSFCNICHYYYGAQHAGMSCGNASCHEANSIHRIVKNGESSGATHLWIEPSQPSITPEIDSVFGVTGSDQLVVYFTEGVYTNMDQTGDLQPEDFVLTDVGGDNPRTIISVTHTEGDAIAIITTSAPLILDDVDTDILATAGISIWDVDGDPAGPWPVTLSECPIEGTSFQLDEVAGSATVMDETGILIGTVNNPLVTLLGDGLFQGVPSSDPAQKTWIEFDNKPECLKEANEITIEAVIKTGDVDQDYDGPGDQHPGDTWPDNSTFNRIFERKRSIKVTILHTDYRGDNVDSRANKASIEVKYFVDSSSRHSCPHPSYPTDPYTGNDSRWHQVSTDIDQWPIVNYHWYRIRVVFNSDKSDIPGSNGLPVDIWVDDMGSNGDDADELWSGFINTAKPDIEDSSSCKWGALPGDYIALEDQNSYIGTAPAPNYNEAQLYEGEIDWVSWAPITDYTGVDGEPH